MKPVILDIERYTGCTALVLGLGESGLASALWLAACGVAVRVADTRDAASDALAARMAQLHEQAPAAELIAAPCTHAGVFDAALLDGIDFVVASPGLAPQRELAELAPAAAERNIPLWSEIELFAQALAALRVRYGYAPKVIAITGTNGKTTVTNLAARLCQRAGLTVAMGGNISPAALDVLRNAILANPLPEELPHTEDSQDARDPQDPQDVAADANVKGDAEAPVTIVAAIAEAMDLVGEAVVELAADDAADALDTADAAPDAETDEDAALAAPIVAPPPAKPAVVELALPQVWVLELSSFQLYTTHSLQADVATVLNITQDHLDWHGDMAAYIAAKQRIFGARTVRVLNRDDAAVMAMANDAPALSNINTVSTFGSGQPSGLDSFGLVNENGMLWLAATTPVEDEEKKRVRKPKAGDARQMQLVEPAVIVNRLMPADALKIRGLHNAVNGLAALALCRAIGLPLAPLLHALRDYEGEPHRVELVATIGGVEYYDDSKGTNVGATVAALNGLGHGGRPNRLLLIAGGDGKGQDFSPLAEPLSKYARAVLLIGRDAPAIRSAVAAVANAGVELIDSPSLEAAVASAAAMAQAGEAVLLSPACASFDMFRGYAHRAAVFVASVREVALSRGEELI